jgi:hypothetical protein
MKTIILADVESSDQTRELVFSNNHLDNYNFVEMRDEKTNEVYTISVDDLYNVACLYNNIKKTNNSEIPNDSKV